MRIFSYHWIIKKNMGRIKTILDVGCGDGSFMKILNMDKKYKITGIDLYKPSVQLAKTTKAFDHVISKDLRKIDYKQKSFDLALSSQVIEHLSKKDAISLIKKMEKIARKKVIIATTNGYFPYDPIEGKDDNPLQVHKSGWSVAEFRKIGYRVYGQGLAFVYKPNKMLRKVFFLKDILFVISYLLSPIIYFFPIFSTYIIAIKEVEQ